MSASQHLPFGASLSRAARLSASKRSWWCSNPIYAPYEQRPFLNENQGGAASDARSTELPLYHELDPLGFMESGTSSEVVPCTPSPANKPRTSGFVEPGRPGIYYMADEDMIAFQGESNEMHETPKGCVYASLSLDTPTLPSAGTNMISSGRYLTPATAVRTPRAQPHGRAGSVRRGAVNHKVVRDVPAPQSRRLITSRRGERKGPVKHCNLKGLDGSSAQRVTSNPHLLATRSITARNNAPLSVSSAPTFSTGRKQPKMSKLLQSTELASSDKLVPSKPICASCNISSGARSRSATNTPDIPAEMHQFDSIGQRIDLDRSPVPTPSPPMRENRKLASETVQAIRRQAEFAVKGAAPQASATVEPASALSATLHQLRDADFMHGEISRTEAEARLKAFQIGVGGGSDGCWLVRRKSQDGQLFALSLLAPGLEAKPAHYRLQRHKFGSDSVYFSVHGSSGTPVKLICTSPLDVVTVLSSCPLTSSRITGHASPMLAKSIPVPESLSEVLNAVSG